MLGSPLRVLKKFLGLNSKKTYIDPDEIFLDSSNLPEFDTNQFEGRIERPIRKQTLNTLMLCFVVIGVIFSGQLWMLQVQAGETYAEQSESNRLDHSIIFAERGVIYDRNGIELAWNTPNEDDTFAERQYESLQGLAHVLGYVKTPRRDAAGNYFQTEVSGVEGVEKALNHKLGGENGLKIVETNALGEVLSESTVAPPKDGENITLSIDARLQEKLYTVIEELAHDRSYEGGAAVIMDVTNGELISLVSYPEYDPNILSQGEDTDQIAVYVQDEQKPFLNRVIAGLYPPGSTIKPFVALGALEEGIISQHKEIESTGALKVPNPYVPGEYTVFPDWKAHGWTDMRRAIAVSSDVYFYTIGGGFGTQPGIGIAGIERFARMFGIGEKSNFLFDAEIEGVIPNPEWKRKIFDEDWYLGNTYHTAIGQYGFQVTPLQMVRATAAIANGGILYTPVLEKGAQGASQTLSVNPENLHVIQGGMRDTVTEGTGAGLHVDYVDVAAKTGSAQAGSKKQFLNSWIIGYYPQENPKYAFTILMERGPSNNSVGGVFVMRQLLDWLYYNAPEYVFLDE